MDPFVSGLSANPILAAQSADAFLACGCFLYKAFSLFHNSLCLPRHLTHFLCLSDAFILAKTVTYVTTLYTLPVMPAGQLYMDNATAVTQFVNNMLQKGKTSIGFAGKYDHCQFFYERYTAYYLAIAMAGYPVEKSMCIPATA